MVLIQGATGVAVDWPYRSLAARRGANGCHGRNDDELAEVRGFGADVTISTAVDDATLLHSYAHAAADGYDVVVDYLWGRPTEILLRALTPDSFAFRKPTRLIQIGESAGPALILAASTLRTSGIEIYGAAKGLDPTTMAHRLRPGPGLDPGAGNLAFAVERVPLSQIETAWQRSDLHGRRLVVSP